MNVAHFSKRFLVWFAAVILVLSMVVGICHIVQHYFGWAPAHMVEFSVKLAIAAVGLVSWLLPSPLHHRHLRIPRVNCRQMAVLIVDDLILQGLLPPNVSSLAAITVQGTIDDRMSNSKASS